MTATTTPTIELKNIKHFPSLSRETNAFTASVFIDGVKVAEAQNDGGGGNTNIKALPKYKQLVADTNAFLKSSPRLDVGDGITLQNDLELAIDLLVEDHIIAKANAAYAAKLKKSFEAKILIGIPGDNLYTEYKMPAPIAKIISTPSGIQWMVRNLRRVIMPHLINGVKVLNNNIPVGILAEADITADQIAKY